MATSDTILLRPGANGKSQPFGKEHAARLLAYPGTLWVKADDNEADDKPAKGKAGAKPEADPTGHPTSV